MTTTTDCPIVASLDKAIDRLGEVRNKVAHLLTDGVGDGWRCGVFDDHLIFTQLDGCNPDPKILARAIGESWMSFTDSWRGNLKGMRRVTITINIRQTMGKAVDLS